MSEPPSVSPPKSTIQTNDDNLEKSTIDNLEQPSRETDDNLEKSIQETKSLILGKTPQFTLNFFPPPRHLNKDLVINILKRRCPTTIFKCAMVSKEWLHVVNDQNFKKLHYNFNTQDIEGKMRLIWSSPEQESFIETNLLLDQAPTAIDFDIQQGFTGRFVGSVNGLICIKIRRHQSEQPLNEEFLIMNPALKNGPTRIIQAPETKGNFTAFGFAFNDAANTYEIVYIEQNLQDSGCHISNFNCHGNQWEPMGSLPYTISVFSNMGIVLNSELYWLMGQYKGDDEYDDFALNNLVLVGLNLASKGFKQLPCPKMHVPDNYVAAACLFNIQNRLNIAHIIPLQHLVWYTYDNSFWETRAKILLPFGTPQARSLADIIMDDAPILADLYPITTVKRKNGAEFVVVPGNPGACGMKQGSIGLPLGSVPWYSPAAPLFCKR